MPASQAFIGHYSYPFKVAWGGSNRGDKIFSIAEHNGIFEWQFHGEDAAHSDLREIKKHYENIIGENYRVDKGGFTLKKHHCRPSEILRTMKLKNQGFKEAKNSLNLRNTVNSGFHQLGEADEDEEAPRSFSLNPYALPDKSSIKQETNNDMYSYMDSQTLARMNHDTFYPNEATGFDTTFGREESKGPSMLKNDLYNYYSRDNPEKTLDPIIQSNLMNYKYEAIDITMSHSLAYS